MHRSSPSRFPECAPALVACRSPRLPHRCGPLSPALSKSDGDRSPTRPWLRMLCEEPPNKAMQPAGPKRPAADGQRRWTEASVVSVVIVGRRRRQKPEDRPARCAMPAGRPARRPSCMRTGGHWPEAPASRDRQRAGRRGPDVRASALSNSTQQATSRAITQPRDQAHRARLAPERERRWAVSA